MKKSTIGVLGIGEVGSAIAGIFKNEFIVLKKDLKFDEIKNYQISVLHVCLPYSSNFVNLVCSQAKLNRPKLIVVHSTVLPGTAEQIYKKTKVSTVHSPVMGTHPNLEKDILNFVKIIGPCSKKSASLAVSHFKEVRIKTLVISNSTTSEIGKLLDTTYYAWNILFCKQVGILANKLNLKFEEIYIIFNQVYNHGYQITKPNVMRPLLRYESGPIGGHCVVPNLYILNRFFKNDITDFIIKTNRKLENKKSPIKYRLSA